jgi:hypothetical protein
MTKDDKLEKALKALEVIGCDKHENPYQHFAEVVYKELTKPEELLGLVKYVSGSPIPYVQFAKTEEGRKLVGKKVKIIPLEEEGTKASISRGRVGPGRGI